MRERRKQCVTSRLHLTGAVLVSMVLLCSGCAPEPGTVATAPAGTGQDVKGGDTVDGGESWQPPVDKFDAERKSATLPASFPSSLLMIPEDAVLDDAGEYSPTSWFVVLHSESLEDATAQWESLRVLNGFSEVAFTPTSEGGVSGTLNGQDVTINILTLPDTTQGALLSLEISTPIAG